MQQYAKAIVAILGGACTAALGFWGPDTNVGRILIVVSAGLTAATVYAVPNKVVPNKPGQSPPQDQ